MRLYPLWQRVHTLPYDHILHSHSHIAVLGWSFLAVLVVYFHLTWNDIKRKCQAVTITITTMIVSIFMFLAFLYQGYGLFSIIFSSIHILVEYWAIVFMFITMKKNKEIPKTSRLFMTGGLISLAISSIGPWSLGVIAAKGLQESPLFDMAVYFYLHFQYNGWLYFMIIGLFIYSLHKQSIHLSTRAVLSSFLLSVVAVGPNYLLSILWYDVGKIPLLIATLSAISHGIAVVLISYTMFKKLVVIRTAFGKTVLHLLIICLVIVVAKSFMELLLLYVPLAEIIYTTRSVVIGYLHLTFLGFVTISCFTLYAMNQILSSYVTYTKFGLVIFISGFLLNEFILFVSGLTSWISETSLVIQNELLLLASILLLLGIGTLTFAYRKNDSIQHYDVS